MKVLIGIVALALSGCALFPQAAPQLSKAVNKYCATLTQDERKLLRDQVNAAIQPNQACVYCAGDTGAQRCIAPAQ